MVDGLPSPGGQVERQMLVPNAECGFCLNHQAFFFRIFNRVTGILPESNRVLR